MVRRRDAGMGSCAAIRAWHHSERAARHFKKTRTRMPVHRTVGVCHLQGVPTGAAEGAQWCLWPDPLDLPADLGGRSNRGPPRECCPGKHYQQAKDTLLIRQVVPLAAGGFPGRAEVGAGGASVRLGKIFWFASQPPAQWAESSRKLGFQTLGQMDATTAGDMALLRPEMPAPLPCGARKCEACAGGCQIWDAIPTATQPLIGNERQVAATL